MELDEGLEAFIKNADGLGRTALKKLKDQTRGGNNNQKGNRLEGYFAVFQLAKRFPSALEVKTSISSQEHAFVDDLVIVEGLDSAKFSYQLKDSVKVNWRGAKGIVGYFLNQHILDRDYFQIPDAKTVLVLANRERFERLSQTVPHEIHQHTKVVHFECTDSANRLLLSSPEFRSAIESLCVSDEVDKLELAVQGLFGAWSTLKDSVDDVAEIVFKAIKQTTPDVFRDFTGATYQLSPEFKSIIDSIEDLGYQIYHGSLNYNYGGFSGFVKFKVGTPEFDRLADEVIMKEPRTPLDLCRVFMEAGE